MVVISKPITKEGENDRDFQDGLHKSVHDRLCHFITKPPCLKINILLPGSL